MFVNHYGSTEIYTFSIGRDQRAKPGCAGAPGAERAAPARRARRRGRGRSCSLRRGLRGLLEQAGCGREGDRRRLVPHGRRRPARRGRRPLDRRPGRRHDRLGRREHPPARGRGRARARTRASSEVAVVGTPTSASASASSRVVVGEATAEELDAHCLASTLARFKRPREYRSSTSSRSRASGRSCAGAARREGATV